MASNTAPPFGVKLGDVDDLHDDSSTSDPPESGPKGAPRVAVVRPIESARPVVSVRTAARPSRWKADASVAEDASPLSQIRPFAALANRQGRPLRVAILSDFVRIPYANGAVFQTRFLYQELVKCGHEVTIIGPADPDASPDELPPGAVMLPSIPLRTYPGVHLPLPFASWVSDPNRWNFDICFAQTTSPFAEFGVWLRKMKGVPLLCVNTTHLAAAYDVLLPERVSRIGAVHAGVEMTIKRPIEQSYVRTFNESDGLVVLSEGLRDYWRERGVRAPIHVIPRAVQPDIFDRPIGDDPYLALFEAARGRGTANAPSEGPRLICAGRHTREKAQDRVIRIFAKHVLPSEPDASLVMIGHGPDTEYYRRVAKENGVADRVLFTGEVPFTRMRDYYAHADIFVHGSLSETYGNVLGEALWCGTPTVAFADGMGVSSQVQDGANGILLTPGKSASTEAEADLAFGRAVVRLIRDPEARARLSIAASRTARERAAPHVVQAKLAQAFQHAQDHAAASIVRPMIDRPKVLQWYTTLKHFRPWATLVCGLYLVGHMRPPGHALSTSMHPSIAR